MICSIAERCFLHESNDVAHAALDAYRRWKPLVKKQQQPRDVFGQMVWPQQQASSSSRSCGGGGNSNAGAAAASRAAGGGGRQRKQQQQQRDKSGSADCAVGDINLVIQQTLAMKSNPIVQRQIEEEDRKQLLAENKMMNSHR
eukprot:GHVS01071932.1.p1 GENE.GHVS01071932.1~~GHVS01071932.1.p1  ORF type:complete len:143 (+),score=46.74 GHVS01071932.1:400-828(+)